MIAYYFRVMEENLTNGWIGLVVGANMEDIFWAIDEFVDPYSVEIMPARKGGYCKFYDEQDECVITKTEFSEDEPFVRDRGWKIPKWKKS